jgi:hypothetical protein
MSTAQKQVIDEHCTGDWVAKIAGPFDEFERNGDAKLRTESSGIYELTSNQLAQWKKAAEPLQKGWVETVRKVGVDPGPAMNDLQEQLVRRKASY